MAPPGDWEALAEIESLTNDRIRQEIGDISIVPPPERVSGPGASWVMAAFTHVGRPSRFSDGAYGVYYCARERETAIRETTFHMGRFYAATREPMLDVDMRVLVSRVDGSFHDVRAGGRPWRDVHDPTDYGHAQALGRRLRETGSNGIAYRSVWRAGGQCLGVFRPRAIARPIQGPHLTYHWDGRRMTRYFDHASAVWSEIADDAPDRAPR